MALLACMLVGCGGEAVHNRTFYALDESPESPTAVKYEVAVPRLDAHVAERQFQGFALLDGRVRVSRPGDWRVRRAALGEDGYIEYVSPRGFLFAIYDRGGASSWGATVAEYTDALKRAKAEVHSKDVPVATATAQGRAFVVTRSVPGARGAYENTSREVLLRGRNRTVLVEVIFERTSVETFDELLHVFDTFEVD